MGRYWWVQASSRMVRARARVMRSPFAGLLMVTLPLPRWRGARAGRATPTGPPPSRGRPPPGPPPSRGRTPPRPAPSRGRPPPGPPPSRGRTPPGPPRGDGPRAIPGMRRAPAGSWVAGRGAGPRGASGAGRRGRPGRRRRAGGARRRSGSWSCAWSGAFRGGGGRTVPAHGAPRARDLTGVRGAEAAIDGAGGGGDPEARLGRVASPGPDAADTGIVGVSAHLRPRSRGREHGASHGMRVLPRIHQEFACEIRLLVAVPGSGVVDADVEPVRQFDVAEQSNPWLDAVRLHPLRELPRADVALAAPRVGDRLGTRADLVGHRRQRARGRGLARGRVGRGRHGRSFSRRAPAGGSGARRGGEPREGRAPRAGAR